MTQFPGSTFCLRRMAIWPFLGILFFLSTIAVSAEPITYTGFTITDGSLGAWKFHNARVYLTFQSDTRNVQFMQAPGDGGTIDIYINQTGKASVTIISEGKLVTATFAPNQIFVSVDLGHSNDLPHLGGRGVGFGSVTPTGIEPTYPLGINEGTLHWGLISGFGGQIIGNGTPSSELVALSTDLKHTTNFSGNAWPCVGFPNDCTAPNPLHTDKGDLYLRLPYWETYGDGLPADATGESHPSLGTAFFTARVGEIEEKNLIPMLDPTSAAKTNAITYYGYVISDVTLGTEHYSGAEVYLSFDADVSTVQPLTGSSVGFKNTVGDAHVTIVTGRHIVSADFEPDQIYVYSDSTNAGIGFGSNTGGNGYPLAITAKSPGIGNFLDYPASLLVTFSTVAAVSDITLHPNDANQYSPATSTLSADLTHPTALGGEASSCVAFDPVTSHCSILTPIGLKTNRGEFYLYEPYRQDSPSVFSVNSGVFWSEVRHGKSAED